MVIWVLLYKDRMSKVQQSKTESDSNIHAVNILTLLEQKIIYYIH